MDEYVNYVDKESNPPNVPQTRPITTQVRPIEDLWRRLAQMAYKGD